MLTLAALYLSAKVLLQAEGAAELREQWLLVRCQKCVDEDHDKHTRVATQGVAFFVHEKGGVAEAGFDSPAVDVAPSSYLRPEMSAVWAEVAEERV